VSRERVDVNKRGTLKRGERETEDFVACILIRNVFNVVYGGPFISIINWFLKSETYKEKMDSNILAC
jgi:hypothetical protein